jgi:hypothetical protein
MKSHLFSLPYLLLAALLLTINHADARLQLTPQPVNPNEDGSANSYKLALNSVSLNKRSPEAGRNLLVDSEVHVKLVSSNDLDDTNKPHLLQKRGRELLISSSEPVIQLLASDEKQPGDSLRQNQLERRDRQPINLLHSSSEAEISLVSETTVENYRTHLHRRDGRNLLVDGDANVVLVSTEIQADHRGQHLARREAAPARNLLSGSEVNVRLLSQEEADKIREHASDIRGDRKDILIKRQATAPTVTSPTPTATGTSTPQTTTTTTAPPSTSTTTVPPAPVSPVSLLSTRQQGVKIN